jgi:hypothetical protein
MSFDVDQQNFENMVHYNSNKLRLIQRGWDPYKVLTTIERKCFVKEGILLNGNRIDEYFLSEEAMELLNEIYHNPL